MRLDHITYRVADRNRTVRFFREAFGYKVQQEFTIDFGNS
jgi:catechol 2,3-dioxygenase-like lactoylglutathione lyase family enzyme